MRWRRGYTVLHFVAECLDDARIVELFALLATDMNLRDNNGKRALDYARRETKQDNVKVLEKVRKQKFLQAKTEKFLLQNNGMLRDAASEQMQEMPTNLVPILHDGIETVIRLGWDQVRWPNEFTILHLACQSGSLPAVKFLLERIPGVARHFMAVDAHNQRWGARRAGETKMIMEEDDLIPTIWILGGEMEGWGLGKCWGYRWSVPCGALSHHAYRHFLRARPKMKLDRNRVPEQQLDRFRQTRRPEQYSSRVR